MLLPNRETLFLYNGKDKLFHHFSQKLQIQTTILKDFAHQQYESQKQPPEVLRKRGVLRNFAKFTGKHLCQRLFFNKVADLRLQNTSGQLLLESI